MENANFGHQARLLMTQRRVSLRSLAKAISYDPGYLSKVLNGHKPPTPQLVQKIDRHLEADGMLVAMAPEADKPVTYGQDLVSEVARETSEHAGLAEATEVGPSALEQMRTDVISLARAYVAAAPLPLFVEMVRARDRIFGALTRRSHPHQAEELYLLAGALCALMANASLDLGRPRAGDELARAAWTYGKIAAHSGLMGWACGTQALVAVLDGRPDDAIEYANRGLAIQPAGMGGARLYSLCARALAGRPGFDRQAREALDQAKNAQAKTTHSDLYSDIKGEFSFDDAKLHYYEAVTRVRIGNSPEAETAARCAINLFEKRERRDRSYGCEALARVQLALARLACGQVEGADDALAPIFEIPPDQRINSLTRDLAFGRRLLRTARFRGSPAARGLDERLQLFCGNGPAPALSGG